LALYFGDVMADACGCSVTIVLGQAGSFLFSLSPQSQGFELSAVCAQRKLAFMIRVDQGTLSIISTDKPMETVYKMLSAALNQQSPSVGLSFAFSRDGKCDFKNPRKSYESGDKLVLILVQKRGEFEENLYYGFPLDPQSFVESVTSGGVSNAQVVVLLERVEKLQSELNTLKASQSYVIGLEKHLSTTTKGTFLPVPELRPPKMIRLCNATLGGSGQFWQWNKVDFDTTGGKTFSVVTTTHANDTVVVKEDGIYSIASRTACTSTANYYASIYIDNSDKVRSYSSSCSGYHHSFHLREVFQLKANSKIQIYQTYSNGPLNNDPYNSFIVQLLY